LILGFGYDGSPAGEPGQSGFSRVRLPVFRDRRAQRGGQSRGADRRRRRREMTAPQVRSTFVDGALIMKPVPLKSQG
jgi:hypothetical protein